MINKGNMNEEGFETSIVKYLVNANEYEEGTNNTYDKKYTIDTERLFRFIKSTQRKSYEGLNLSDEQKRNDFIKRLNSEIQKRDINDVLKQGIKCYPVGTVIIMFYLIPSERNLTEIENFNKNIF